VRGERRLEALRLGAGAVGLALREGQLRELEEETAGVPMTTLTHASEAAIDTDFIELPARTRSVLAAVSIVGAALLISLVVLIATTKPKQSVPRSAPAEPTSAAAHALPAPAPRPAAAPVVAPTPTPTPAPRPAAAPASQTAAAPASQTAAAPAPQTAAVPASQTAAAEPRVATPASQPAAAPEPIEPAPLVVKRSPLRRHHQASALAASQPRPKAKRHRARPHRGTRSRDTIDPVAE